MPAYISLQSALYLHGMIEQIPETLYAISLSRTKQYSTVIGDVSIHHLDTKLFCGFSESENNIELASPEKAIFDFFYFAQTRSKAFGYLPELTLLKNFSMKKLNAYVNMISNKSQKNYLLKKIEQLN